MGWGRIVVRVLLAVWFVGVLGLIAIGESWWAVLAAAFIGILGVLYVEVWRKAATAFDASASSSASDRQA